MFKKYLKLFLVLSISLFNSNVLYSMQKHPISKNTSNSCGIYSNIINNKEQSIVLSECINSGIEGKDKLLIHINKVGNHNVINSGESSEYDEDDTDNKNDNVLIHSNKINNNNISNNSIDKYKDNKQLSQLIFKPDNKVDKISIPSKKYSKVEDNKDVNILLIHNNKTNKNYDSIIDDEFDSDIYDEDNKDHEDDNVLIHSNKINNNNISNNSIDEYKDNKQLSQLILKQDNKAEDNKDVNTLLYNNKTNKNYDSISDYEFDHDDNNCIIINPSNINNTIDDNSINSYEGNKQSEFKKQYECFRSIFKEIYNAVQDTTFLFDTLLDYIKSMKQESTNNDTLLNRYEKKLDKINDEISCIYEIINVFVHNKNNKLNNKFYNYYNNKTIYNKQIAMNALSNLKKHMFNLSNETNILVNKLQRNTFSLIESMTSFIESIQDKLDNDNNNPVRNFYNHVRNIKHMDFIL